MHQRPFEASPENYHEFGADEQRIFSKRVRFLPLGVSDKNEFKKIYVPSGTSSFDCADRGKRGTHSFLKRKGVSNDRFYVVPCVKLDDFFQLALDAGKTFVLWIDVEGATLEALSGAARILGNTKFLKVEIYVHEYWEGQSSEEGVLSYLERCGFHIAYRNEHNRQYDGLFVRY